MMVNCAPAKCLCLPDLVPAQAIVRAGNGGGNSECGGWARLALRFWRGGLPRFTPGLAVLAPTFCLSLRPALRFWLGCCHRFARSGLRLWRGACPRFARGDAVLLSRFALGLRAVMRFYCGVLPRFTPAVCRLAPNRTACGILRSCSAGSRSPLVRSRGALRLSAFVVSLRDCAFYLRRSRRGCRERWVTGAGGAVFVRFYASALALLCFPRGVRWG